MIWDVAKVVFKLFWLLIQIWLLCASVYLGGHGRYAQATYYIVIALLPDLGRDPE